MIRVRPIDHVNGQNDSAHSMRVNPSHSSTISETNQSFNVPGGRRAPRALGREARCCSRGCASSNGRGGGGPRGMGAQSHSAPQKVTGKGGLRVDGTCAQEVV